MTVKVSSTSRCAAWLWSCSAPRRSLMWACLTITLLVATCACSGGKMRLDDYQKCVGKLDVVRDRIDHCDLARRDRIESRVHHVCRVHERTRRRGFLQTVIFQQPRFTPRSNELMHDLRRNAGGLIQYDL